MAILSLLLTGAAPILPSSLEIDVEGLRSTHGLIQLCLVRDPHFFPDCKRDPAAHRLTIPVTALPIHIADLPPGDYAVALIHDENGNGKLDTMLGIPREGIGFSRNPRLAFGPPSFESARFTLSGGPATQSIRMKYFL